MKNFNIFGGFTKKQYTGGIAQKGGLDSLQI